MNTTKELLPGTKIVNKDWLENQIKELNQWLFHNSSKTDEQRINEHNRNYYVAKLIELEEKNLKLIEL